MQTAQFKKCTNCDTLENLYNQVNCSIYKLIKNKWTNQIFNTEELFDGSQYKLLLRLKRILYKRLYNPTYPDGCIKTQDIISLVTKNLYKPNSCPSCPCEDFTDFITTTTTSTSTTTSTTVAP